MDHACRHCPQRNEAIGEQQAPLGSLPLAHIAKDHHRSEQNAVFIDDRGSPVVDRDLRSTPIDQGSVLQVLSRLTLKQASDRACRWGARLLVDQLKNLPDRLALGLLRPPAGKRLGDGVEEGHPLQRIGGNHSIADAPQGGGEPALALAQVLFHSMLVEGDLDRAAQLFFTERLDDVAKGLAGPGAVQALPIGEGGQEDHRHAEPLTHQPGRLHAVHLAPEHDVHQDQVGMKLSHPPDRFFARGDHPGNRIAEAHQSAVNVGRYDFFVLDDEDVGHGSPVTPRPRMRPGKSFLDPAAARSTHSAVRSVCTPAASPTTELFESPTPSEIRVRCR